MQQKISLVVAMNHERVIGVNNQLPWHIPEDLAYFKSVTIGKPIIMGRKTFQSIGRVLPGRKNIVVSRSNFEFPDVFSYSSLESALADNTEYEELAIIGGGDIFHQSLSLATKLYLTLVDFPVEHPTVWFPAIDLSKWQQISTKSFLSASGVACSFNEYVLHK